MPELSETLRERGFESFRPDSGQVRCREQRNRVLGGLASDQPCFSRAFLGSSGGNTTPGPSM
jgi:hypothetical protein